jgi:RNA polymerase sigma-70 factor, ECF subfamily
LKTPGIEPSEAQVTLLCKAFPLACGDKKIFSAANGLPPGCSLLVGMPNAILLASSNQPPASAAPDAARAEESFVALVERHSRFVYRIALAVARDPHAAEDVAQETFLQIYRGGRWQQIEDERGYLARVAWRLAVRQRKARMTEQELAADVLSQQAGPEETAMERQQETWLHSRIDALPEKLRQPLALAALGEMKLVEIAKVLGLPEGTVRRRIHTARQKLKQELAERDRR